MWVLAEFENKIKLITWPVLISSKNYVLENWSGSHNIIENQNRLVLTKKVGTAQHWFIHKQGLFLLPTY
jgi:hypothetical protein